jgi:hypothetical protein
MALPPLLAGAVQLTVAIVLLGTTPTIVGAPGAVAAAVGVTAAEAAEAGPAPTTLLAVTENV